MCSNRHGNHHGNSISAMRMRLSRTKRNLQGDLKALDGRWSAMIVSASLAITRTLIKHALCIISSRASRELFSSSAPQKKVQQRQTRRRSALSSHASLADTARAACVVVKSHAPSSTCSAHSRGSCHQMALADGVGKGRACVIVRP
jgi:hypothetical protein